MGGGADDVGYVIYASELEGFDVTCVGAGRALCQTGLSVHVRQLVRVWGVPAEQA